MLIMDIRYREGGFHEGGSNKIRIESIFRFLRGKLGPRTSIEFTFSEVRWGPGQALVILRRCGPPRTSTSNSSPLGPLGDFEVLLGKIQRGSYAKSGAKRREIFRALLWTTQKGSYKNLSRSAGEFVRALLGKAPMEFCTQSGAKRRETFPQPFCAQYKGNRIPNPARSAGILEGPCG